ncbi:MAG: flagellar hook-basal body complex protein [Phycisphaerales bacterium]|nr:MAG: flagellar hook-basal body complex protein [Phycisphaerales bacterium]
MGLTTSLFTGLSGLNANGRNVEVIGNNISNVNTTAYKSSRMMFETQFSHSIGIGSEPSARSGGTNPTQIGLGVRIGGTQRDMSSGGLNVTGDQRDMAIDGKGFFIVDRGGQTLFTRAGAFRPNENNVLTTVGGEVLMGYGVDGENNVLEGALRPVEIPLGTLTIAEATRNVRMSGNLDADGAMPTQGSLNRLMGAVDAGLRLIAGATNPANAGNLLEVASLLTEIEDPALPGSGVPLFADGQVFETRAVQKGDGRLLPTKQLAINPATTVEDLMAFLNAAMGLQGATGANPDGRTPGVTLDGAGGVIEIVGNAGGVNDLTIEATDLRLLSPTGELVRSPFMVEKAASADGESVRTSFVVYDSLGSPVTVDVSMVLEGRGMAGTTWRYYVESPGNQGLEDAVGTGTVRFDTNGQLLDQAPIAVNIDRAGTGAATPLNFNLFFQSERDNVTSLADARSQLGATFRDGAPIGTLSDFGVGPDGVITGAFTNGLTRTIGAIPLATFTNDAGLVEVGGNLYDVGPNAGNPVVVNAAALGSGRVIGGALELSNVDLGQEFINLILASTGYSASSRVIQTSDDLLQQLLVLGR